MRSFPVTEFLVYRLLPRAWHIDYTSVTNNKWKPDCLPIPNPVSRTNEATEPKTWCCAEKRGKTFSVELYSNLKFSYIQCY